jgi:hypothetical protein
MDGYKHSMTDVVSGGIFGLTDRIELFLFLDS